MNQYIDTKNQEENDSGFSSNGTHLNNNNQQEEMISQNLERLELQQCNNEVKEEQEQEDEERKSLFYPLRPNVEDCSFFVKTGTCKFGQSCRFNHPVYRDFQDHEKGSEENNGLIVDSKKIDCKYHRTPGGCRYGDSCRYNHSAPNIENEGLELNFLGLPVRPSEQECAFYLRTGSCAYGANCRFNHPDPTAVKESEPQNRPTNMRGGNNYPKPYASKPYQSSGALPDLSNGISMMNGLSYAPMNSYHQTMPYNTGWKQDQANLPLSAKKTHPPYQTFNNSKKEDPSTHYQQVQSEDFPVRPGQPDCDFFMKTGDCKYRAACRFNHPPSRVPKLYEPQLPSRSFHPNSKNYELPPNPINTSKNGKPSHKQQQMPIGIHPERPGQPECEFFMKTGTCKFGSACKYHHPRDRMSTHSVCALNEDGLPLRPGAKICRNYEQQGTCKYGQNCLFHHPDNIAPGTSDQVNEDEDHRLTSNVGVAIDLESTSNVKSNWGDDWVM